MKPMDRRERAACLALFTAYVLLRVVAARPLAFDLLDPEELLNLRMAWQLHAGLPVGDFGGYWYTGAGGNVGGGPLLLSLLYAPWGWLGELDFGATRAMAVGWSALGALALAGLGRALLGRGGAAATLAVAVCMPPSWLAWTLSAHGNYVEGAVLVLCGAWAGAGEGRGRVVAAGGLLTLGSWVCVSSIGPALVVGGVLAWRLRREAAWAALGAVLMAPLWAIEPTTSVVAPVDSAAVREGFVGVLTAPWGWPAVAWSSVAAVPFFEYREVLAEDWGPAWLAALEPVWKLAWWGGFVGGLVAGWRVPRLRPWVVAGAVVAVGVPSGLTALGVGPSGGPVEPQYFFDGRRGAIVMPVLALGLAGVVRWAWRRPGWVVVALGVLGSASMLLAVSAEGPSGVFRPGRYLVCPGAVPAERDAVCVDALWEEQVPALEALVDRFDGDDEGLATALRGFSLLDPEDCSVRGVPDGEPGWLGLGAAVRASCDGRAECGDPACEVGAGLVR